MGLYKQEGSPFWNYRFSLRGRRIFGSTKVKDKKLAQKIYEHERSEYVLGKKTGELKPIKLSDMLDKFLTDYSKVNKISHAANAYRIAHFKDFLGDVPASEVGPNHLERYKAHRRQTIRGEKPISVATVNRELSILGTAYAKAIEWGLVAENPVRKVKFFSEKDRAKTRYLSQDEKSRLKSACSPELWRVVLTALKTGCRISEILGLKWADIDSNSNTITLRKTKSGAMRYIPIHRDIAEVIRNLPKRGEYVFSDNAGNRYNRTSWIRTEFEKALNRAGIREATFHTLRHTFASELVMKGADIKSVSELLGHTTTRMTERYSHLSPSHRALVVNLLGSEGKTGREGNRPLQRETAQKVV